MRLFVYGTLRSGSRHPLARRLRQRARCLGRAWLPGRLYRAGRYPIGVFDPRETRSRIEGELWEVPEDARLLAALDRYEGCGKGQQGGEFVRHRVTVHSDRGAVTAWAWVARREPRGLPRIRSGYFGSPAQRCSPRDTASSARSSRKSGNSRRSNPKRWAGKVTG